MTPILVLLRNSNIANARECYSVMSNSKTKYRKLGPVQFSKVFNIYKTRFEMMNESIIAGISGIEDLLVSFERSKPKSVISWRIISKIGTFTVFCDEHKGDILGVLFDNDLNLDNMNSKLPRIDLNSYNEVNI